MSDLDNSTEAILQGLVQAYKAMPARRNFLNKVAEGEIALDPKEVEKNVMQTNKVRTLLAAFNEEFLSASERRLALNKRGSLDNDTLGAVEALPVRLRTAYELLVINTYGSIGIGALSGSVEQGKVGRSAGKPIEWRTTTGKDDTGRSASGPKKFGAGKAIVKNQRAFDAKRRIDKKLRRVAIDIEDFLTMDPQDHDQKVCSKCNKYGEPDWGFCPRCGGTMKVMD